MKPTAAAAAAPQLLGDIRQLIEQSRGQLATAVNSALTMLYWHIGQRIRSEVLQGQRATYGEQMVAALAKQLEADYGRGFSAKNLRHMLRFAEVIPSEEIVSAVRRQLSWTHFRTLIYIGDPLKRAERPNIPELEPSFYGFTDADMETVFNTSNTFFGKETMPLRELLNALRETYCGTIGAE